VIGPAANNPELEARIREADRLRDSKQYAAAAEAYAAALAIAPQRHINLAEHRRQRSSQLVRCFSRKPLLSRERNVQTS
jgi:hypothetical protein